MKINQIIAYSIVDENGDSYIRLGPSEWLRKLWPYNSGLEELCFAEYYELEETFKAQEQQDFLNDRYA